MTEQQAERAVMIVVIAMAVAIIAPQFYFLFFWPR
jgi:hypothetical protein